MDKKSIGIATLTLVVVLGVAMYVGSALSGIGGAIREVSEVIDSAISSFASSKLGAAGTRFPNGVGVGTTSPTVAGELIVDGPSRTKGTTTPDQFLFTVGGSISTAATGTARTLYTNTTGPKLCIGGTGALSARNIGNFSPLQTVSIGTSTSAVTTTNLIASTTIATSTPGTSFFRTFSFTDSEFVLQDGDELMAITGTGDNADSSSTNLTNLTLDARLLCSEIAI